MQRSVSSWPTACLGELSLLLQVECEMSISLPTVAYDYRCSADVCGDGMSSYCTASPAATSGIVKRCFWSRISAIANLQVSPQTSTFSYAKPTTKLRSVGDDPIDEMLSSVTAYTRSSVRGGSRLTQSAGVSSKTGSTK